ncbi:aminoacyl-tRNA deacylase [Schaalia sp. 19OD2882]|uniref:aminoacyl-tRNA deacylase n=1 Tax=Schaalia sp. 19OD2882 TaxID=2794089 RepID=UPI001C1EE8E4|nr:aminoacyl-tRNA deacylase [Schaalia sp. 19OD2882]QWW19105.1 aminoacyl-tRNA deacylase [Schaalia sp. 19OD2882]
MGRRKDRNGVSGAPTRALEALVAAGVDHTVHIYDHDPRARTFGQETVDRLGIAAERTCKSLMVRCEVAPGACEYVVAVIPVRHHLCLKAVARAAGCKSAAMADPKVAERRTGYVVGGISPLGQTTAHRLFLEETVLDQASILISGGRRGMSVEVDPWVLVEVFDAVPAPLVA